MTSADPATVRCTFYVKTAAGDNGWHYDLIDVHSPAGAGSLPVRHPPGVGDLIWLWDSTAKAAGVYRVMERFWMHAQYGSMVWRMGHALPSQGPELTMLVEPADGLFVDQVLRPEEADECEEQP